MKQAVRVLVMEAVLCMLTLGAVVAQKIDEERMERDIEIAENVLSTLIKQKFEKRSFFPIDVEGKYLAGFGVTFRVPGDFNSSWFVLTEDIKGAVVVGEQSTYNYTFKSSDDRDGGEVGVRTRSMKSAGRDSLAVLYNQKVIEAGKEFLADYGDLISQLTPEERIMITNRGDNQRFYYGVKSPKRTLLSLEASKGDMAQVRQGKMTRDQFIGKIKVVNTTSVEEMDPDLELLSSIFNRLYREDLSKTYYTNEGVYYERLKDFGAIYYMNVVSSEEMDYKKWRMPTQDIDNLDQAARDKKVTELYPAFEKDLKENMLEYGRTLRSLKDNEGLVFNVKLTKCLGCGIPSTIELTVKNEVLKQYSTGQLTKEGALAKVAVKKGPAQ
jgi:hypothetical protein